MAICLSRAHRVRARRPAGTAAVGHAGGGGTLKRGGGSHTAERQSLQRWRELGAATTRSHYSAPQYAAPSGGYRGPRSAAEATKAAPIRGGYGGFGYGHGYIGGGRGAYRRRRPRAYFFFFSLFFFFFFFLSGRPYGRPPPPWWGTHTAGACRLLGGYTLVPRLLGRRLMECRNGMLDYLRGRIAADGVRARAASPFGGERASKRRARGAARADHRGSREPDAAHGEQKSRRHVVVNDTARGGRARGAATTCHRIGSGDVDNDRTTGSATSRRPK